MGKPGTVVSIVLRNQLFIMDKFRKQLGIDLQEKTMYRGKIVDAGPGARDRPEQGYRRESAPRFGREGSASGERQTDGQRPERASAAPARPAQAGASITARRSSGGAANAAGDLTARTAAGQSGRKPAGAPSKPGATPAKPGKSKKELERERKNKGAPKWLKAKRDGEPQ